MDPLDRSDPTTIGAITLRGRLGAGGMGRVFFGLTEDYEPVAVKVVREDLMSRPEVRARFAREIEALRTVQGPHVATLVEASDEEDVQRWFAMEYIRGLTLKEYVESRERLSPADVATLGVLLADALADIHDAGLLHRDLKPGNVLLGRSGPKVIDLGLAGFSDGPTDLTTTDTRLGTPEFMSPEQVSSIKELTTASDVYSLGATLLSALTRHPPYKASTVPLLLMNISDSDVPPDLSGVPERFIGPLSAMLAHEPAERPTVPEAYARLKELATAEATTLPVATRRLVAATYVERESDPDIVTARPRPRRRDVSEFVKPGSVVANLAARLRVTYAADARF